VLLAPIGCLYSFSLLFSVIFPSSLKVKPGYEPTSNDHACEFPSLFFTVECSIFFLSMWVKPGFIEVDQGATSFLKLTTKFIDHDGENVSYETF